jgi:hypothetical protein
VVEDTFLRVVFVPVDCERLVVILSYADRHNVRLDD